MHLVSPALPIGAYAFSQGMESAVEQGVVRDEQSARDWVLGVMANGLARLDIPIAARLFGAWQSGDVKAVEHWNAYLFAARETAEFQHEDVALGRALARLLPSLGIDDAQGWRERSELCFATMFTRAASAWEVPLEAALHGLLWAWLENQVAAATRLVPLGQTSAQRVIFAIAEYIAPSVAFGLELGDSEIGGSLPGWSAVSVRHEEQYSRLFQS